MRRVMFAACAGLFACNRTSPNNSDANDAALAAAVMVLDAAPSPRCKLEESGVTFGDVGDRRSLVIGDAIPSKNGFSVGLVHSPATVPQALVARVVDRKLSEQWIIAKGTEIVADAPPPIPLIGRDAVYAAYLARDAEAGASRRIEVMKSGVATAIASFRVQSADSLSFDATISNDASRLALAWDDDAPKDGGIRVAVIPLLAVSPVLPRVVSDGVQDVDAPRLAARANGGWWAAWLARREESPDAGPRVEVPGEARAFTWVEIVALDDSGAPVGPVRRLTAPAGHVASFDLAPRAHGELDVFARDETQAHEGEGGRILHIVVHDASVDEPVIVATGAGRGAVDLVSGATGAAWLVYVDAQDHPRLVPLGESRMPAGPATLEDELDGARLLVITSSDSLTRFAAAVPASDGPVFREVTCSP